MGIELAKAYITIAADSQDLAGDLSEVKNEVTAELKSIQTQAAAIMGSFSAFGVSYLRRGLSLFGQYEQNLISFETMLGGAEQAKDLLGDLTKFAADTPFEMPEILQAARGLVQFGERGDELIETLNTLGNAASGTSTPFGFLALVFNQIRGVGKLLTQDFRQLSTRGVLSLQDIADHFGVTTAAAQEMLSSGQISFEDTRAILEGLSGEGGRFYNLMERQSTSLLGLQSTLSDAWNIMARVMASDLAPAAKMVTSAFVSILDRASDIHDQLGSVSSRALQVSVAVSTLATTLYAGGIAAKFFGISMKAALMGSVVGISVIAGGALLGAIIGWVENIIEARKETAKMNKEMNDLSKSSDKVKKSIKEAVTFQVRGKGHMGSADLGKLSRYGIMSTQDIAEHFEISTDAVIKKIEEGKISFEEFKTILDGLPEAAQSAAEGVKNAFEGLPVGDAVDQILPMIEAYAARMQQLEGSILAAGNGLEEDPFLTALKGRTTDRFGKEFNQMMSDMESANRVTDPINGLHDSLQRLIDVQDKLSPKQFSKFRKAIEDEIGAQSGITDAIDKVKNNLDLLTGRKTEIDQRVDSFEGATAGQRATYRALLEREKQAEEKKRADEEAAQAAERRREEEKRDHERMQEGYNREAKQISDTMESPLDKMERQIAELEHLARVTDAEETGLTPEVVARRKQELEDEARAALGRQFDEDNRQQQGGLAGFGGRFGIAEIGSRLQDMFADPKEELDKKRNEYIAQMLGKQDETIAAIEKNSGKVLN